MRIEMKYFEKRNNIVIIIYILKFYLYKVKNESFKFVEMCII